MSSKITRSSYAEMFGPTTGDKVRLADTDLFIEVENDLTVYGEEVKFGGGKVIRDGMGQSQVTRKDGAVDTVITNALIVDVNGIFKATKTNIMPICVSIKPIFENIIKIGKLKDIPGIVLVNIINKKYLFLCLKLCLAKPYPPIVPTNTAINVLVKEIISEFRK